MIKKVPKCNITVFGEASVASVYKFRTTYVCIRDFDGIVLAWGPELKGYIGDIIRTMYTGEIFATGDFILESDRHGMICKFK